MGVDSASQSPQGPPRPTWQLVVTGSAAAVLSVLLGLAVVSWAQEPDAAGSASADSSATPSASAGPARSPAAVPDGLDCPDGTETERASFDFAVPQGDQRSPIRLARDFAGTREVVFAGDRRTAYALRPDGTAHLRLTLGGNRRAGFVVASYEACAGEGPAGTQ